MLVAQVRGRAAVLCGLVRKLVGSGGVSDHEDMAHPRTCRPLRVWLEVGFKGGLHVHTTWGPAEARCLFQDQCIPLCAHAAGPMLSRDLMWDESRPRSTAGEAAVQAARVAEPGRLLKFSGFCIRFNGLLSVRPCVQARELCGLALGFRQRCPVC